MPELSNFSRPSLKTSFNHSASYLTLRNLHNFYILTTAPDATLHANNAYVVEDDRKTCNIQYATNNKKNWNQKITFNASRLSIYILKSSSSI